MIEYEHIDQVFNAYVNAALWASLDDNNVSLDRNWNPTQLSSVAKETMRKDVYTFIKENEDDVRFLSPEMVGHDFWLTRNRHGAGFWDRGLGNRGDRLTASAHGFGESYLYVGDDGYLHIM